MADVILAIDPGPVRSAWLRICDDGGLVVTEVMEHGIKPNEELLFDLRDPDLYAGVVVIEQIESFGMAVGREIFETVRWAGRFEEAAHPVPVELLPRRAVKLAICGSAKAKDANLRQALIDRFGGVAGKAAAVGTKARPGPLHGIANDVWSALAIAVTFADQRRARDPARLGNLSPGTPPLLTRAPIHSRRQVDPTSSGAAQ